MASRKIIRGYKRCSEATGKSRITIWRDVKAGTFPAPIELGPNSIGWFEDEIDEYLATRPRRTYPVKETTKPTAETAPETGAAA